MILVPSNQLNSCPCNKICKREKEGHQSIVYKSYHPILFHKRVVHRMALTTWKVKLQVLNIKTWCGNNLHTSLFMFIVLFSLFPLVECHYIKMHLSSLSVLLNFEWIWTFLPWWNLSTLQWTGTNCYK
jgi:hypothetical protein